MVASSKAKKVLSTAWDQVTVGQKGKNPLKAPRKNKRLEDEQSQENTEDEMSPVKLRKTFSSRST